MKPEQRFWKTWLKDRLPAGHATRIESEVEPGFPDVHFSNRNGSVTLELKVAKQVRIPLKGQIRDSQKFWIREEVRCHGRVWIVALIRKKVYFIPGRFVDQLDEWSEEAIFVNADLTLTKSSPISHCKQEIGWLISSRK